MNLLSYKSECYGDSRQTHINTSVLCQVNHLVRQESVPEETVIRPLPQRRSSYTLSGGFLVLLSLKRVREVPAVREPQLCALQPILDERNKLLLDRVVQYRRGGG